MKNDTFSKRDVFFFVAGPATGAVLAILGYGQIEVIQWTFTINLGLTGAKEGLMKIFEYGSSMGDTKLKDATIDEIKEHLESLSKDG